MSWKVTVLVALMLGASVVIGRELGPETATWDSTRAAGWVAYLLLWAAVFSGVGVDLRFHPGVGRQQVVLELHRMSGTLGIAFVLAHGLALTLDRYVAFDPWDIVVPLTSDYRPVPVALGVVALWLTAAILVSTWVSARIPRTAWRSIHLLAYPAYVLALLHGLLAGSDTEHWPTHVIYSLTAGAILGAAFLRSVARDWVAAARGRAGSQSPAR
ncbi:ferric reductase-like transmembrane domain-containing protein [Tepidiforma sp.]|uniref:ferric reductase-like transmembrane domain-containing protein n=1 Tax=Tepidiforma sp. TaxID=2682230 RepID=UPI002ADDF623|nr:ferric reductase-like transmembrane domain-containing protein [Tepidiforma sp.]